MKKKCQVVMLPTNEKADCTIVKSINYENTLSLYKQGEDKYNQWIGQHLYILSDDEIKSKDYYFDPNIGENGTIGWAIDMNLIDKNCKKIIATTDTNLIYHDKTPIGENVNGLYKILSQPSPQFIAKYVEEFNKGNQIKEVMVEYDNRFLGYEDVSGFPMFEEVLKVDKNNQITITRIKDSWNKEEHTKALKNVIYQAVSYPETFVTGICCDDTKINKWIEENL